MKKTFTLCLCAFMASLSLWAQDIIVTTDAQKIDAKILEVSKTEIKYKESNYLDGPTFIIETKEINTIIYGNGKVVLYNQAAQPAPAKQEEVVAQEPQKEPPTPTPQVTKAALALLQSDSTVLQVADSLYIGPSDIVANLVMSEADYDNWIQKNGFSSPQVYEITKKLYTYFDDDFDVIMLVSNEKEKPETIHYYGINKPLANSVKGIGKSIYSYAKETGSEGKLFSVMHIPYVGALQNGPTLHEFAHCWANAAVPTVVGNHWGICGGSTPGQLGGFKQSTLQTNVDGIPNKYSVEEFGVNANGGNCVPYNDLELYLMGMLPIDSVAEFDVFPVVSSETFDYCDESHKRICFYADSVIHYTPQTIIDSLGVREPDYLHSQKSFKALFVVLSKAPLTEEEWEKCEGKISWFCQTSEDDISWFYNFWEATRGIGSVDPSDLTSSLKLFIDTEQ